MPHGNHRRARGHPPEYVFCHRAFPADRIALLRHLEHSRTCHARGPRWLDILRSVATPG